MDIALDIFHDNNGIVDDDADRKHHAEQCQRIDRITQQIQPRKCANHRDGHRNKRNDGCAPGLQEQNDDQHYQDHSLDQRVLDRMDRFAHEHGRSQIGL